MSVAITALQRILHDGRQLFPTRAQCADTVHRAVHAGVIRRILPGGGAAPRRWALLWPVRLGTPAHVPWTASPRPGPAALLPSLVALAAGCRVEWRTGRAIAVALGWHDMGAVARVHQHLLRALRGGAPGLMRRRAADHVTWCWAMPVGACHASEAAEVVPSASGRVVAIDAVQQAQQRYRMVALTWEMLLADGASPDDLVALRQHVLLATTAPSTTAAHATGRVLRLDGRSGRVWYALHTAYAAADAELTLRGVADAAEWVAQWRAAVVLRRAAEHRADIPPWLVTFLWRVGAAAARQLRGHRADTEAWRQLAATRAALLAGVGLPSRVIPSSATPPTRWIAWRDVDVTAWGSKAGFRRLRDLRDAARSAGVWCWEPRVVRALPNARVCATDAHRGELLVERTDLLLWLGTQGEPAVAVAARVARGGLGLQRGPEALRWCAVQRAAGEPWARVARVAGAALCGRLPSLASDIAADEPHSAAQSGRRAARCRTHGGADGPCRPVAPSSAANQGRHGTAKGTSQGC